MFEASLKGLLDVFQWPAFGFMLLGIAIGFAVGILPGLGGAVTLALMLPFTFDMPPVQAFSFLLGMLSVTATTGDITSILFAVPGEVTSAAVILDGHPMSKAGEAGRAVGAALMSSLIGAVIGALVLALSLPVVQPLVLSFGTPEFFMLAIVALTLVATLSRNAPRRGLIAAGLGLTLALVGLDPISGIERYTFGQMYFWEGVSLVPVAIGLFAIPEIIELAGLGNGVRTHLQSTVTGTWTGVKDTFTHFWLVVRSSILGTLVGLIPGVGAALGQWIAYGHAVQSASDKSRFGKGDVRGVLAPGAANNSSLGGSLIPTVAFGIPGSITTAILLGAFLIQGLVPGRAMLTTNLSLTFTMVWLIIITNVITVGVCLLFVNHLVKITYVRPTLLIPGLLLLVFLGAYSTSNTYLDVIVMLAFGVLGWLMIALGWPRAPLVLALVLGSLAENYLYLAVQRYGWKWLTHPIVLVLIILAVLSLASPLIERTLARRGPRPPGPLVLDAEA